jgi:hypothetical protein
MSCQSNTVSELGALPGMVRRWISPADTAKPLLPLAELNPMVQRPVLLLATASIGESNIFNNGLYQNCFLLYRLAEAIGWMPIFVVNTKPKDLSEVPEILRSCRIAEVDDILSHPLSIKLYLEVGMSISSQLRRFMKMMGARTAKLYLGNIVNIDIETPMFFPGMNFAHHVVGEQDEIWTSPHYLMNMEYAAALNQVEPEAATAKIAPYVWDSCIVTDDGRRHLAWKPRGAGEKPTFIIMEPNISFQKTGLIPLLIVEEMARANPTVDFEVIVLNGERLTASGYFATTIEPSLRGCKGKIKYAGRHDMISIMKSYPNAYAICHHFNNEFNYMVLEFLHCGYPVLHNCEAWKEFGYYYAENDTAGGMKVLCEALNFHHERLESYKGHARTLFWRHSIYNPDVQKAWLELMNGDSAEKGKN